MEVLDSKKILLWDDESVLQDGDAILDRMLKLIQDAKSSIRLEVYIFDRDHCGDQFVRELSRAVERGVSVQLLVDGIGSFGFSGTYLGTLTESGVSVRMYHPTPHDVHLSPYLWWVRWKAYLKFLGRINKRNHRKVLIVDEHRVVVGSANITAYHLSQSRGGQSWRDTAVEVSGHSVASFITAFERAWEYANRLSLERETPTEVLLVPALFNFTSRLRKLRFLFLLELFYQSKDRIWITNAYFVPDGSLLKALRFAAWTGIDVRVLVPHRSDVLIVRLVQSAFYYGLLTAGVKIYEYLPRVLHSKTLLIDQMGIVGTSNLNHRSAFHDLEVDVMLQRTHSIRNLESSYEDDLKHSRQFSMEDWEARPFYERVIGLLILRIRYWL